MNPAQHEAAVATETAALVTTITAADLSTPVPTCPDWTLEDLTRHVGSVHRWFTELLRRRIQQPPTNREVDLRLPEHPDALPDWLAASAAEAAEVFAATDPDAPMWAWGVDQHARFWVRRMLFETLVHRVDAELALGLTPHVDRALAVDGIDEFLTNLPFAFPFAPLTARLRAADRTLRLSCTDGDEAWTVRLRPDGFALVADDAEPRAADATVRGSAADLLLALYGRLDHRSAAFHLLGEADLPAHWFAHSAF
ncbi:MULTISPECIES: maleylpyruvate isomerase family mycothiol-dependent enzyme [unclassified Streptomyces]|uniref:maleylpyruvate isomerase family mycothiol-dependent enzyme n=1 Tax=unclassified Streptomyces TaxID=2593676 RepID=UPI00226F2DBA|nr:MULTISPECIES: maleylpyruvate isomerase family mycothiol-dependent enzyme [unclassified Streptomyces]MCY0922943.1 maleylpyruvate isomerase family mycothiol-dependent enzyme [Streptomyces sp. H27-G5]MCY0958389.1 maleylpyruvate isomerase family mycothiol-dependent enzyme [Streptomyces sp. H27-H5]